MPDSVTTTSGRLWIKRKAHAGMLSWGRNSLSTASSSGLRAANLPPLKGSMTHTGIWYSFRSSISALASWKE